MTRFIILAAGLLLVFIIILLFQLHRMKGIPGLANSAILDAFAGHTVFFFIGAFILVWGNARYGIPEHILMARWLTTIFMAAIVVAYFVVRAILRLKFLPKQGESAPSGV